MARRRRTLLGTRNPVLGASVPQDDAAPVEGSSGDEPASDVDRADAVPEAPGNAEAPAPVAAAGDELQPPAAPDAPPAASGAVETPDPTPPAAVAVGAETTPPVPPDPSPEPPPGPDGAVAARDDAAVAARDDAAPSAPSAEAGDAGAGDDWEAWRTAGMDAALRSIGDEFDAFGDPPPTEEVSSALYEDYTTPFDGSVHVPEPPPIPGLGDRFTPPPVQRTPVGTHQTQNRPSYLAEPTPSPAPDRVRDFKSYEEELRRLREAEPRDPGGPPRWFVAFVAVSVLFIVTSVAASVLSVMPDGTREDPAVMGEGIIRKQVKVRADMRQAPGFIGVDAGALSESVDDDAPAGATPGEGAAPGEGDAPGEAAPVPVVQEAAPSAPPSPPKATATAPPPARKAPPAPEPTQGTLRIRSNRRVLVYIDDRAVGYTPQDLAVPPGSHRVSAMLPGQPESRQVIDVQLQKGGDVKPVDFRF